MYDKFILQFEHYNELEKYKQALDYVTQALAERPDDGYALLQRGWCQNHLLEFDEALDSCKEAAAVGFDEISCHELFAEIYLALDEIENSKEHLLAWIELDPLAAVPHARLSLLYCDIENFNEAEYHISKALEIDPLRPTVLEIHATILDIMGEKKKWESVFNDFADNSANEYAKLLLLGNHYNANNKKKKAMECYQQAYSINPDNSSLIESIDRCKRQSSPMFFPLRIFWFISPLLFFIISAVIFILLVVFGYLLVAKIIIITVILLFAYFALFNELYEIIHKEE